VSEKPIIVAAGAPYGDYLLLGYTVSSERAEITFRCQRREPGEPRHTEVTFVGVVTYRFEHDDFGTILTHIIDVPLASFLTQHADELSKSAAEAGACRFWKGSVEEATRELEKSSIRAFEINSAIGMHGWALARTVTGRSVSLEQDDLARIEALCTGATPGPWTSFIEGRDHESGSDFMRTTKDDIEMSGATHADQDFIASARQDVPALVAEVRRLRKLLDR
jgi:hypothetical protein